MEQGKIIILNGVSSSGKTTLARKMQDKSDGQLAWLSVDMFCDMWLEKAFAEDFVAAYGRAQTMLYRTAQLFSDSGIDVVIDIVLLSVHQALEELITVLQTNCVLLVHVTCPPAELRRREKERGDRAPGQAESQLAYLVPQGTYDITVDTADSPLDACAQRILSLAARPTQWTAFQALCAQASAGSPRAKCIEGCELRAASGKRDKR